MGGRAAPPYGALVGLRWHVASLDHPLYISLGAGRTLSLKDARGLGRGVARRPADLRPSAGGALRQNI